MANEKKNSEIIVKLKLDKEEFLKDLKEAKKEINLIYRKVNKIQSKIRFIKNRFINH